MAPLIQLLPRSIDPYQEALAYEYLYSLPNASLKTISAQTVERGLLPTEAMTETMVFPDERANVQATLDSKLGTFGVAVASTPQYPEKLTVANERVPLIYYKGNINLIGRPSVSVVGARAASEQGKARAARLARELARAGVCVVSGLAAGIDTAALESCIGNGGDAIAVIGTPIDVAYPRENARLQSLIGADHLLVSQVPFHRYAQQAIEQRKQYFRERNVTMAAISDATVIVEASDTSGSLIQAHACMRQGRSLFLMRSCLERPNLAWPEKFVAAGAQVLDDMDDLLSSLPIREHQRCA